MTIQQEDEARIAELRRQVRAAELDLRQAERCANDASRGLFLSNQILAEREERLAAALKAARR